MSSLSSRRAPETKLKLTAAAAVLLVAVFLAFLFSSCEGRRFQDVANLKVDGSLMKQANGLSNADTRAAMDDHMARAYAMVDERVSEAASSPGAVRSTIVARVSRRLSVAEPEQREGTGFHLDYAGPRTHTPSHN